MSEAPKATILVVDDNEANCALARDTLEDEGYRVVVAGGGGEGLAAFTASPPDCVVLDVRMPGMDGFAVCDELRRRAGGDVTPILFLTALRDVETFDRAIAAGADDFVTKPVRPAELVVRVQTALELRRLGKELREHYDLIRRQRDDLIRLQLQKERLMAFVVHDLKNPLSAVDLHVQLLERDDGLSEDARESVAFLRSESRLLNRMIENLRDLTYADDGALALHPARLPLEPLVVGVIAELRAFAELRKVTLAVHLEADALVADGDVIRRALANLVDHAVRRAPARSTVKIFAERGPGVVALSVADEGAAIPTPLRASLFDPQAQLEAGGASRGGRALGLAFCKLAAEAHGGCMTVDDPPSGAVLRIELPASEGA